MRTFIVLLFLCLFVNNGFSQQDPQFSFNSFNHLAVNPGFAGLNQAVCFSAIHRNQWMGFEGNPVTTSFAGHMNIPSINSGAGLNIIQDKLGFNKDFHMNLAYAYHVQVAGGILGIGVGAGVLQKAFDAQELRSPDALNDGSNVYNDPAVPHSESVSVLDANAGLFFRSDKLYAGLSATHLTKPELQFDEGKHPFVRRHGFFTVGYYLPLPDPRLEFKPSLYVKYDGASAQFDLNALMIFNRQFWGGFSYRLSDALVTMVGFTTKDNLGFGLAYDATLSSLRSHESGSLELLLKYCFKLSKKPRTTYRDVRGLNNIRPM